MFPASQEVEVVGLEPEARPCKVSMSPYLKNKIKKLKEIKNG
jgi:hypothetical protein